MNQCPWDLLPVTRPFDDPNPPSETDFYEKVVKPILPDIMAMEEAGIPINLEKVKEIEVITDRELGKVQEKLSENPIIQDFLKQVYNSYIADNYKPNKTKKDFEKEFKKDSTQLRTFIVNAYLKDHDLEKDQLDKWTLKDLKKYANMRNSLFLLDLAKQSYTNPDTVNKIKYYMDKLAEEKYRIYLISKKETVVNKAKEISFNPNSAQQKVALFQFLGIEPDSKTKKGQDQWNRKNLEILQKKLELELGEDNG